MSIFRWVMAKQYSISEARNNLPNLIREVEHGPPVELTRRGHRVAVLLSINDFQRLTVNKEDLWTAIQRFRAKYDLSDLDIDQIYGDVRDRSPGREVVL
jgi:prevent-host-death family protein